MGIGQSRAEGAAATPTKTVRIEKDEIPEEFRNVGVSSDVVDRMLNDGTNSSTMDRLKEELLEARKRNEELLVELRRKNKENALYDTAGGISIKDLENRREAFNEAIGRVEKQFCTFQRENVCELQEKKIMECVASNKNRVLNCLPLLDSYEGCVANFRRQVLSESSA